MLKTKTMTLAAILISTALLAGGCGTKPAAEPPAANTAAEGNTNGAAAKSWDKKPEMAIDTSKSYQAVVKTTAGEFTIDLYAKDAPETVNSFVFLSKQKFFEGIIFHRIMQTFMIQTGDPTGTGAGGPGYNIPDELDNGYQYEKGVVAMANTGQPNTGGSQFFIGTGDDVKNLNSMPNYSIFGKVSSGMDVIDKIAATPVISANGEASTPAEKVSIESIEIKES